VKTEIGELVVGAWLREIAKCDFVNYNVRPPEKGLEGLAELDVVGLRLCDEAAFLCEVTTHLDGLLYGSGKETIDRIRDKHKRQQSYAESHLKSFKEIHFMFWSPVVRSALLAELENIGLELVVNKGYTECVEALQKAAGETTRDTGNPFFRSLQILAHLR
jgi:hypothetical protein